VLRASSSYLLSLFHLISISCQGYLKLIIVDEEELDANGEPLISALPALIDDEENEGEQGEDILFPQVNFEASQAKYSNLTTRLFYRWWSDHRGAPLTEKVIEELLSFMTHPNTTPKSIAPTIYHLKRAGEVFIPSLTPIKLPKSNLMHFPIADVVALLLGKSDTMDTWHYTYDASVSGHPCSTRGWKDIEDPLSPLLAETHKLLLLSVYIDDYRLILLHVCGGKMKKKAKIANFLKFLGNLSQKMPYLAL
jgi:hypothetical protein